MDLPLIGSYDLEAKPHSVQRTVNLIPVPQEPGNERTAWVLKDVKGLETFSTEADAVRVDPYFDQVGYLLHFDGIGSSDVYVDEIGNTWGRTSGSNTNIGVYSTLLKYGAGGLRLQNASGTLGRISTTFDTTRSATNNVFTVEGWVYWAGSTDSQPLIAQLASTSEIDTVIVDIQPFLGGLRFKTDFSTGLNSIFYSMSSGAWHWVEANYDGATKRLFVDGALVASASIAPGTQKTFTGATIGYTTGSTHATTDAIDDARGTFGIARNTGAYTPPTEALPGL